MEVCRSINAAIKWRRSIAQTRLVGLVPTMGCLHAGHGALVQAARDGADVVAVSIFVNPLQFGPQEDFQRYPRTLDDDLALLERLGVTAVFVPEVAEMYPRGESDVRVTYERMNQVYCGALRPGHFSGVLTVVLKLFHVLQPGRAWFGKKDYQQWHAIRRMVEDLSFATEVVGIDTIREDDGLALSSRNRYLGVEERRVAPSIYRGLKAVRAAYAKGERRRIALDGVFRDELGAMTGPVRNLEYFEIANRLTLAPAESCVDGPSVALVAVRLGGARLIDNIELE